MIEAIACGWALLWINFQHKFKQVFEASMVLAPLVIYNIVQ